VDLTDETRASEKYAVDLPAPDNLPEPNTLLENLLGSSAHGDRESTKENFTTPPRYAPPESTLFHRASSFQEHLREMNFDRGSWNASSSIVRGTSQVEDKMYDAFEAQLRVFGREITPKEVTLGKVIGVGTRYDIYTS
jgi:hypothetical protein